MKARALVKLHELVVFRSEKIKKHDFRNICLKNFIFEKKLFLIKSSKLNLGAQVPAAVDISFTLGLFGSCFSRLFALVFARLGGSWLFGALVFDDAGFLLATRIRPVTTTAAATAVASAASLDTASFAEPGLTVHLPAELFGVRVLLVGYGSHAELVVRC